MTTNLAPDEGVHIQGVVLNAVQTVVPEVLVFLVKVFLGEDLCHEHAHHGEQAVAQDVIVAIQEGEEEGQGRDEGLGHQLRQLHQELGVVPHSSVVLYIGRADLRSCMRK